MRYNYSRPGSGIGQAAKAASLEMLVQAARMSGVCTNFATLKVSTETGVDAPTSGDKSSISATQNDPGFGGHNA